MCCRSGRITLRKFLNTNPGKRTKVPKKRKKPRDIEQGEIKKQIKMAPDERQALAHQLKIKYYGKKLPDVRDY
jgi:hypothetical protein